MLTPINYDNKRQEQPMHLQYNLVAGQHSKTHVSIIIIIVVHLILGLFYVFIFITTIMNFMK